MPMMSDTMTEEDRGILRDRLAQLPEDVKRMALAYAQGVASGRQISRGA